MVDWESFYSAFRRPGFIPGYEIQNHLGSGTFGEVYRAKKTSIGKSYAIKFLRFDGEAHGGAIERELDGVRLFAAIDHPNLVTIEDMGMVAGVPFLVMGYAGEETLARQLKSGSLDRKQALRFFVQACRGVLALHDRRLAHFDLKPGNIFLRGDVARVGDYGLSKLLVEGRETLSFGRGTPQYMAPEMIKNRADHRADLYSLGVVLFESLTGRLPYGHSAGEGGVGVIVREDDVAPDFPSDYPDDLRAITTRLLRIEPGDRFAGVQDLLASMGQAARPGESVRIRFGDLPVDMQRLQSDPGTSGDSPPESKPADSDSNTGDDLKQAAAELARGVVGVARGVFGGMVERVSSTPVPNKVGASEAAHVPSEAAGRARGESPVDGDAGDVKPGKFEHTAAKRAKDIVQTIAQRDATPAPRDAGDVVSMDTLSAPADHATTAPTLPLTRATGLVGVPGSVDGHTEDGSEHASSVSGAEAPWRKELERARDERHRVPGLLAATPAAPASVAISTIPVPPRAAGGWVGNIAQSIIVGGEIMGVLITGPFFFAVKGVTSSFDRVLNGVPGVTGSVLRMMVVMLFMMLLGGLTAFGLLAAFSVFSLGA